MGKTLLPAEPAPRNCDHIFDRLGVFAKQKAQLLELIRGIEAMQPQYDIPYFDLTTEETVAGLRDRIAEIDRQSASAIEPPP